MKLTPMDTKGDNPNRKIFCRGCDAGALAKGAFRDVDSEGGIDLYCADCADLRFQLPHGTSNLAN